MINLSSVCRKTIAILGMGKSGLSSAQALIKSGAIVWAWDDDPIKRIKMKDLGLNQTDLLKCNWKKVDVLLVSPGIPTSYPFCHPIIEKAKKEAIPITCDVELFCQLQKKVSILAITGTNGKSTTTALTGHILQHCGIKTQLGSNFGNPVFALNPSKSNDCIILELSLTYP